VSKTLKRHHNTDSSDFSDHKIKALKKREVERRLAQLEDEDYFDDEDLSSYINEPKFYRAIKGYR